MGKKAIIGVSLVLLIIAATVTLYYTKLHGTVQSDRLIVANSELAYLKALERQVKDSGPETNSAASVFISSGTINAILAALDGTKIDIGEPPGTSLLLNSLRAQFRDGFPELVGSVAITNSSTSFTGVLYATLELRQESTVSDSVELYVHPLAIGGTLGVAGVSAKVPEMAQEVLRALAVHYLTALPHVTVPLSKEISSSFPAGHVPVTIPTQSGSLHGEIDIPALSVSTPVFVSEPIFLADGAHVFLHIGEIPKQLPLPPTAPTGGFINASAVDAAVQRTESEVTSVRTALQPKLAPIRVQNADFRLWLSKTAISYVFDTVNRLSQAERNIHYHTLSEEGQIYRVGGGGLGCGGYANIVGGNSASADVQLSGLSLAWSDQAISASGALSLSFQAQVTGHVNGPAGPHTTMVLNCVNLGIARPCTDLPSVTVSCDTPIGGGAGLGSYGVSGNRTENVTLVVHLHQDTENWLLYELAVTKPDQIPITLQVGLGQLGTAGIPISFPVPHQTLVAGKAPAIIGTQGSIVLPPPVSKSKNYELALVPTASTLDTSGYAATGQIKVAFK